MDISSPVLSGEDNISPIPKHMHLVKGGGNGVNITDFQIPPHLVIVDVRSQVLRDGCGFFSQCLREVGKADKAAVIIR